MDIVLISHTMDYICRSYYTDMEKLSQYIESLIFVSDQPIGFKLIKESLENHFETKMDTESIEAAIDDLIEKYQDERFAIEIVEINNGFKFMTKGAYHGVVGAYIKIQSSKRLSTAALETLAIIAYKQPVIKSEMEKIRGVSCDYSVQKLLEKELIAISGRSDGPGRPLLYSTSEKFMEYFGLKDMTDMPKIKDFKLPESQVGEPAPLEEEVNTSAPSEEIAEVEAQLGEQEAPILGPPSEEE